MENNTPENSSLGKKIEYVSHYDPSQLFPIPRKSKREEIGIDEDNLPFKGIDCWNGYELSWLNNKGRPQVGVVTFIFPCESSSIIESKSFKLYLNSFNQTKFENKEKVIDTMERDLARAVKSLVSVNIISVEDWSNQLLDRPTGTSLDDLDIAIDEYDINTSYLKVLPDSEDITENLFSHLLKSNCLVTGQPDWGSVYISYQGKKIDHEGLLKYIISFREHNEFHEQCVERIFNDLKKYCRPNKLTVYARYTRRGGLDINPFRSDFEEFSKNMRTVRQ